MSSLHSGLFARRCTSLLPMKCFLAVSQHQSILSTSETPITCRLIKPQSSDHRKKKILDECSVRWHAICASSKGAVLPSHIDTCTDCSSTGRIAILIDFMRFLNHAFSSVIDHLPIRMLRVQPLGRT